MAITYRRAVPEDVPQLVCLLHQLFTIESDFKPDPFKQQRGLEMLVGSDKDCIMVAVDEGGKVLGMVSMQSVISTAEGGMAGVVEDMVVSEDCRGKGVGKQLLQALYLWAAGRGITRLQLLADTTNAAALAYYTRLGWEPTKLYCWRKYL